MAMARTLAHALLVASAVGGELVTIHKVDYPVSGLCGEEANVTKSNMNPHYFFPMHFGGFHEGPCKDAGFPVFERTVIHEMNPVPGVHHNLTFDLYARTTGPVIEVMYKDGVRNGKTVRAKVCMPPKTAAVVMVYELNATFVDFFTKTLANDAAFLADHLTRLSLDDESSVFYGRLGGPVLFGGHSMGGGVSILAAATTLGTQSADGMVLFAPGMYTIPSATPHLKDVKVPSLIVSGTWDCGPNQLPKQAQHAFDGLNSTLKVLVALKGANHCQWADTIEGEGGVCAKEECHLVDGRTQRQLGVELFAAFAGALAGGDAGWNGLEQTLAAGEANGTWTYFSSKTSPSTKALHNDCPCKGSQGEEAAAVNATVDLVV